jgi:hypothetical protein
MPFSAISLIQISFFITAASQENHQITRIPRNDLEHSKILAKDFVNLEQKPDATVEKAANLLLKYISIKG